MVLKIGIAIKDVTILKSLGNENNYQIQILNSSDIGEINFIDNYWDIIIWQPEFSNHKIPEIFIKYFNRNKNALLIVCCSDKKKFNIIKSIPNHFVFEIDNFYSNAALNLLLDNIELIRKQKSLYLKDNISIMQDNVSELVGKSSSVKEINEFIHLIAKTSNTHCLIRGEVGSEKRVVAKLIHRNCKTILGPLQFINCANYSEKQMSFKLFGVDSEKELTAENQNGALEISTDGTIVLENIERLPEELQQRLQIFLETQTFRRDKSDFELSVNTRVIATTSYDLENFVTQGEFLKELYYRFKAFEIFIPPLRQRKNDIIPIANHFINYFNNIFGYNVKGITKAVEQRLINYNWRGNVDELKVIIERAVLLAKEDEISYSFLPDNLGVSQEDEQESMMLGNCSLREIERKHIEKALKNTKGNKSKAAEILNISRTTLRDKLRAFDLLH